MGTSEKIMHYANFNITYGPTEDPMLTHFEDIIWPAFLSDFKRGKKNEHPLFYLSDIALKEISGDMVLVGIGFSAETVVLLVGALNTLIGVQLGIFGCIFAVYSIILAFLSDSYMKKLAEIPITNKAKKSMLTQSTTYYESVLFLYFINIGLTGISLILCNCLPSDFRLTTNWLFDCLFATALMILYFTFSFRVFYEVKSTIYNTIVLFRASIAYKFIDFSIDKSDEK